MISFNSLLIVGLVAVVVPLLLGLLPAVKVHPVVLEIVGGILVGWRCWAGCTSTWPCG